MTTETPRISRPPRRQIGDWYTDEVTALVETGLRQLRMVSAVLLFPYIIRFRPGPDTSNLPVNQWTAALFICGALALTNVLSLAMERVNSERLRSFTGFFGLAADTVVVLLIVEVMPFFDHNLIWFILVIPMMEAGMRFGLAASIGTWLTLVGSIYVGETVWDRPTNMFDNGQLVLQRLGLVLLVSIPAVYLAQKLLLDIRIERRATGEAIRRSRLLENVAHASQRISRLDAGMVDEVLDSAVSLGFEAADVCVKGFGDQWRLESARQTDPSISLPDPEAEDGGLQGVAELEGTILYHEGQDRDTDTILRQAGLSAMMVCPLGTEGDATVALRCGKRIGSRLTRTEAECIELLAGNATIALHNKRLVGELRGMQHRLQHQAYHDVLTGLSNRSHFIELLDQTLIQTRENGHRCAVAFIDLDRFKPVNDSLGHDVGNELLVAVARRLTSSVRETDLVARMGGDEFVVLLHPVFDENDEELTEVADRICRTIAEPFVVSGNEVVISCSVGLAVSDTDVSGSTELIRRADLAMYRAKALGKARWEVYEPSVDEEGVSRIRIETDLRRAVANDQIAVEYQGIISVRSGQMIGAETLLRWNHPVRGPLRPDVLVEIAEDSGLIIDLGQRVMEKASCHLREWQDRFSDRPPLVAVNVSPFQLFHPRFFTLLDDAIRDSGIDPSGLIIEITENIISAGDDCETLLHRLKERGVKLALDDFGQGQTSLRYLRRFPIDLLKIDKTFVQQGDRDPADRAILNSIISLAHDLGLVVIAEGVENLAQLRLLRELDCDLVQGFLLHKPMPPAMATDALARTRDRGRVAIET